MKSGDLRLKAVVYSAFLLPLLAHSAQAQFEELVKRFPESTNTLIMVDATAVYSSDIAQKEGWSDNRASRFAAGMTAIPPDANKAVLAAHIDWEFMRPSWEAELVTFDKPPELASVADRFGGKLDTISTKPAIALPDDSYIIELSKNLFGVMTPANRQVVSRWIRQSDAVLSPYLQAGVAYEDKTADIIIALDLTDAISESAIRQKMDASDSDLIKNLKVDQGKLAKLLASIRGVMLGINFGTKANGSIRVDFGQDASMLSEIGKPLLLHILGNQGAMINEFEEWDASVSGKTLSLKGTLTYSGLTRISSLIEPPTRAVHAGERVASASDVAKPQDMAQATQAYFESIDKLFGDLKRQKRDSKTYGQTGYFYGKYAEKITNLPILNVDPQMIDYGGYVSGQLRAASDVIKGVGIRSVSEQTAAAANTSGYYDRGWHGRYGNYWGTSWGGVGYDPRLASRRAQNAKIQVRQNERAQGSQQVVGIISQIDDAKLKIRRAMTEKYQIEF